MKFTLLTRDIAPYLTDRYSERVESADRLYPGKPACGSRHGRKAAASLRVRSGVLLSARTRRVGVAGPSV